MQVVLRAWTAKNATAGNKSSTIQLFIARINDQTAALRINRIVLLHRKVLDRKMSPRMFMIKRNPRFY